MRSITLLRHLALFIVVVAGPVASAEIAASPAAADPSAGPAAPLPSALFLITPIEPAGSLPAAAPARIGRPLVGDALEPPDYGSAGKEEDLRAAGPLGAGYWDGSEYLLGRVGVVVVLVESDGTEEPSTENWTGQEEALVLAGVGEAMDWWAARAPGRRLEFHFEIHTGVPVAREPIRMAQRDEEIWIGDALESLGFSSANVFRGTRDLASAFQEREKLDWTFTIYVVDSSEDEDGMFSDGFFAYAYLGGPYMVLTLDNDGWGAENLASVCAHETGHIFYALDQYYAAHVPCDRVAGYLGRETRNSEYGSCGENEAACIMRSRPLASASLSETARGQVGWADSNGDGIPDPLGAPPEIEVRDSSGGSAVRVEGRAAVGSIANRNPLGYGHAIAVDTIRTVEVRIDDGEWTAALLEAGPLSPREVSFRFEAHPSDSAEHRVLVRAVTGAGSVSEPLSLTVRTSASDPLRPAADDPPAAPLVLAVRPNPFNPAAEIVVRSEGGAPAVLVVYDARGAVVRQLFDGVLPPGEQAIRWDGLNDRGREAPCGRYFCRAESSLGSFVATMILIR